MKREMKGLLNRLRKHGYSVTPNRRGGHVKITHPEHPGKAYFCGQTPSDRRAVLNTIAGLRRTFGYQHPRP